MLARYSFGWTHPGKAFLEAAERAAMLHSEAFLTADDAWFISAYDRHWVLEGPR